MEITLVTVKENELNEVAQLAHRIWNDHYPAIIGQQQVDYMLNKFYALPALIEQVHKGQEFYFILADNRKQGFLSVSFSEEKKELFIHKFYILTQQQKSGLGTRALQAVEKKYPQARSLRLTVNRQNHKSINFYFKNGFIIGEVADFDIGDGYVMNDFVMLKKH
jgi:GNAT superfamily N-acetyltransferase